jgi:hypothetical protein
MLYLFSFKFKIKGADPNTNKIPFYHTFGCGLFAGCFAAYFCTPLDGNISYLVKKKSRQTK